MKKILLSIAILAASVGVANATVANNPQYTLSGTGSLGSSFSSSSVLDYTFDFGNVTLNSGSYTANFSLKNTGSSAFDVDFGTLTGALGLNLTAPVGSSSVIASSYRGDNFTLFSNKVDKWAVTFNSATANIGNFADTLTIAIKANCEKTIQLHLTGNVVSPVPEAEEWAMMMLGLGMMGFVAKRKQALAA